MFHTPKEAIEVHSFFLVPPTTLEPSQPVPLGTPHNSKASSAKANSSSTPRGRLRRLCGLRSSSHWKPFIPPVYPGFLGGACSCFHLHAGCLPKAFAGILAVFTSTTSHGCQWNLWGHVEWEWPFHGLFSKTQRQRRIISQLHLPHHPSDLPRNENGLFHVAFICKASYSKLDRPSGTRSRDLEPSAFAPPRNLKLRRLLGHSTCSVGWLKFSPKVREVKPRICKVWSLKKMVFKEKKGFHKRKKRNHLLKASESQETRWPLYCS